MRDFFSTTVDDWTDTSGQLHAYLIPEPEFARQTQDLCAALQPFTGLGIQPAPALHLTVERFAAFRREQQQLHRIQAALNTHVGRTGPVTVTWTGITVTDDSVIITGTSPQWAPLTNAVRQAVDALSPARRYTPVLHPHVTLAYATASIDDTPIRAAVKAFESLRIPTETFIRLDLCAVHQNSGNGTYTFETITSTPLSLP